MDWITGHVVFSLGGMVGEIIRASVRMREGMRAGNQELGADCDLCYAADICNEFCFLIFLNVFFPQFLKGSDVN